MENRQYDVTALGELLIDFTQCGTNGQGNPVFEANPGGAPANVLAMLKKLGKNCAFLGKVGADSFGDQLEKTLINAGIDTAGLFRDQAVPTTLALVHTLPGGDRDFSFYRKPGADIMLTKEEVADHPLPLSCRIFHFGSLSLTDEPCESATKYALQAAKEAGALISCDPNYRPPLWPDEETARRQIAWALSNCDILKIADNEVLLMTGTEDFDEGAAILKKEYPGIRLLNITAGAGGSYSYYDDKRVFVPALSLGGVIETTGAGDTFCACVLNYILEHGLEGLSEQDLADMLRFANTAAYIVTTRRGAICSMPELPEIEELLANA